MNRVSLLGRVVRDIELRHSQTGTAYTQFNLAVNRRTKSDAEQQADFISCKAFGKTAEILQKHCGKGRQIAVEGHIQTGKYDKDGQTVYTTDIIIDSFFFADSKKQEQEQGDAYEPDDIPFE